jgi:hypothetical protein
MLHLDEVLDHNETDVFIGEVLATSFERNVTWIETKLGFDHVLDLFLRRLKSNVVFREWLRVPRVGKYLLSGEAIVSMRKAGRWDTVAHALAQSNRADFMQSLLDVFPHFKHVKVSSM